MDEIVSCPSCHQPAKSTDYFCPSCGKKLHSPLLSTSLSAIIILLLKTLLLPPFGFWWGYRYLRQSDNVSKYVGLFTVLITFVEIIWLVLSTISAVTMVNQQINQQLQLNGL